MAKKAKSPEAIRAEIERLQESLASAEAAEKQRKVDELTKLVSRAGRLDEALDWARSKYGAKQQRQADGGGNPTPSGGSR